MAVPFARINRTQTSWNKHKTDAVQKSMKNSIQRSEPNIDMAPAFAFDAAELLSIVAAGGGKYVGVLKEIPNRMESVILFNSPRTRTTLGLPISHLTVEAVRERLAESDKAFAGAGAK
jgi:hypothetical protein